MNGLSFIGIYWLFSYFIGDKDYSIIHLLFKGLFVGVFMEIVYPYILEKTRIKFSSSKIKK
ncbi:hypothetical protein FEDK69T_25030 [Flavobacterium enshiense DK69]|nr:hypothetical protein FEDK69T_25030 [Flavobacterium enshiense DK69]